MKGKVLITATMLVIATALSGCEAKETTAETDVYSKLLLSDTSVDSYAAGNELDISRVISISDNNDNDTENTDSDTEKTSENTSSITSSSVSSTTSVVTREVTTYYYYYENEEPNYSDNTESSNTDSETTEKESSDEIVETETDTESDSGSESSTANVSSNNDMTDTDTEILQSNTDDTDMEGSFNYSDMAFVLEDAQIRLGDNIEDYKDILGIPLHITDNKNSEGNVTGKLYSYQDFSIETVFDEKNEYDIISSIEIFSDDIITIKGIKIGDNTQQVTSAYGREWIICNDEYRYYIGNTYMFFYIQNDIVANIGYRTDTEMEN